MNEYEKLVEAIGEGIVKVGNTYANSLKFSKSFVLTKELEEVLKENKKDEKKLHKDVMDYVQIYIIENLEFSKHGKDIFKINKLLLEV
ncbi:hypothetical protein ABEY43_06680 [Priestia megaterium]